MLSFRDTRNFIGQTRLVTSEVELKDQFAAFIGEAGIEYFACASFSDFSRLPENQLRLYNIGRDWITRYRTEEYKHKDLVMKAAKSTSVPFLWRDLAANSNLSSTEQQIFDEAADIGMEEGMTIPIHVPSRPTAVVSVSGADPDFSSDSMHAIHLAAIYLHDATTRLARFRARKDALLQNSLSQREQECLRWVASGKSDYDISTIIGISRSTVHFHVESAKKKYGVATRVQAVVRAIIEEHIDL